MCLCAGLASKVTYEERLMPEKCKKVRFRSRHESIYENIVITPEDDATLPAMVSTHHQRNKRGGSLSSNALKRQGLPKEETRKRDTQPRKPVHTKTRPVVKADISTIFAANLPKKHVKESKSQVWRQIVPTVIPRDPQASARNRTPVPVSQTRSFNLPSPPPVFITALLPSTYGAHSPKSTTPISQATRAAKMVDRTSSSSPPFVSITSFSTREDKSPSSSSPTVRQHSAYSKQCESREPAPLDLIDLELHDTNPASCATMTLHQRSSVRRPSASRGSVSSASETPYAASYEGVTTSRNANGTRNAGTMTFRIQSSSGRLGRISVHEIPTTRSKTAAKLRTPNVKSVANPEAATLANTKDSLGPRATPVSFVKNAVFTRSLFKRPQMANPGRCAANAKSAALRRSSKDTNARCASADHWVGRTSPSTPVRNILLKQEQRRKSSAAKSLRDSQGLCIDSGHRLPPLHAATALAPLHRKRGTGGHIEPPGK